MRDKKPTDLEETKPQLKHCRLCTFYIKRKQETDQEGRLRFSAIPGMQFHHNPEGTFRQRIGSYIPCTCSAGLIMESAYNKQKQHSSQIEYEEPEYSLGDL